MKEIKELLPQRAPFLFLDAVRTDNEIITGQYTYKDNFIFKEKINDKYYVPSMIILESLMQCGGAGMRLSADYANVPFAVVSVSNVHIHLSVPFPAAIQMQVKTLQLRRKYYFQQGRAFLAASAGQNKPILSAAWQCLALEK